MRQSFKYISPALVCVALAALAILMVLFESDYLWKSQELNLFLPTSSFFHDRMLLPGGFLSWCGAFLTQFFYIPWLGAVVLCLCWALVAWMIAATFRIPVKWAVLTLIPVALLFLTDFSLGYWLYYMKLQGAMYVASLGVMWTVASIWIFRSLTSKYFLRIVFVIVYALLAYPLAGAYGLAALLLMAVISWRLPDMPGWQRLTVTLMAIVAVLLVPQLFSSWVYYQIAREYIYVAALPSFIQGDCHYNYYLPYLLILLFLVTAAFFYRQRPWNPEVRRFWGWLSAHVVLLVALGYGLSVGWYRDSNFHKELTMQRAIENLDWDKVVGEARQQVDEPTRAIIMMRNLALWRLGRQGDEMYHFRPGSKQFNTPVMVRTTQVAGRTVYFNYGQLNFCYRWCLEDGVEYGWKAEYLKFLTRCSLLNGEFNVARKYINLLKKTLSHKKWAINQERFLNHPELLTKDQGYGPIVRMVTYQDMLNSDNNVVEQFLMHQLLAMDSDDPLVQEQSLIAALWMKDIGMFWPRFFKYCSLHQGKHIPTHYQEAAYLYGHLESQVDISHMPFDQGVVNTYENFMARAQQYSHLSEEMMAQQMYPEFGHTFFFEYYLNRNQQLY